MLNSNNFAINQESNMNNMDDNMDKNHLLLNNNTINDNKISDIFNKNITPLDDQIDYVGMLPQKFPFDNLNDNNFEKQIKPTNNITGIMTNNLGNEFYVGYTNNKFKFFDHSNSYLGSFTIQDIMLYINDSPVVGKNCIIMIEQFLCKRIKNKNIITDILLLDYKDSALMGDIELLLKLNHDYGLNMTDKSEQINKLFHIKILNYILKLISIKWHEICMDNDVKLKYVKFVINIINKINQYILSISVQIQADIKNNNNIMLSNHKMRMSLNSKINEMLHEIPKNDTTILDSINQHNNRTKIDSNTNSGSKPEWSGSSSEECMVSFSETKDETTTESSSSTIYSISSGTDDCSAIYDA